MGTFGGLNVGGFFFLFYFFASPGGIVPPPHPTFLPWLQPGGVLVVGARPLVIYELPLMLVATTLVAKISK